LICGSPRITGSWIPRAPTEGFWWHLHVGSFQCQLLHCILIRTPFYPLVSLQLHSSLQDFRFIFCYNCILIFWWSIFFPHIFFSLHYFYLDHFPGVIDCGLSGVFISIQLKSSLSWHCDFSVNNSWFFIFIFFHFLFGLFRVYFYIMKTAHYFICPFGILDSLFSSYFIIYNHVFLLFTSNWMKWNVMKDKEPSERLPQWRELIL